MDYVSKKIIRHKAGLLNPAEELGNVSQACKIMGLSRDTFYRYKQAVDNGGIDALIDADRRKPNLKNRVDESIEKAVLDYAVDEPMQGQARVSNELRKRGIFISRVVSVVFGFAITYHRQNSA
jgi:ACT domain-containing protein